jgi:hypothetical protein
VRFLLVVAVAALLAVRERGRDQSAPSRLDRALDSRWAPAVVALLWAAVIASAWGSLHPAPLFHDELSYLLQARLFAEGRWTAPSPPLADMWAQAHVLVAPVMASKYPPGHALLLSIGQRFDVPAVIVLALAALRGAMVFVLARRLASGAVALATSVFLLHGDALHWGASYFSETTTGALVLVCWYALLRWHQERRTAWLALVALTLGWCAITRPVTALAFALPIGVVVLRDTWRHRRWCDLGVAIAIGTAIVAILPLWSAKTTGDWRLWPATLYTRDYMPYDYPHFGVVEAQPRRELPSDLATIAPSLLQEERAHTLARAPEIAGERLEPLAQATWRQPLVESLLALLGLLAVPAAAWVGVATVATLFLGYLAHPTWAAWTIYYMEIAPVLVFLSVCGFAQIFRLLASAERAGWRAGWRAVPRATNALAALGALALVVLVLPEARQVRRVYDTVGSYQRDFLAAVRVIPPPAVLFVHHAPWHSPHLSLITNGPDWPSAPVWIVADRGAARNLELIRRAGGRKAYLYDESRSRIDLYRPPGAP